MHILHPQAYMVLGSSESSEQPTIKITPNFSEVLSGWTSGTRCSPVWRIRKPNGLAPERFDFNGHHFAFLIGPIQLASLASDLKCINEPDLFSIWASVGTMNVVLLAEYCVSSVAAKAELIDWATAKNAALECWEIKNGGIIDRGVCLPKQSAPVAPSSLNDLVGNDLPSLLRGALQEYCALMASALCRSKTLVPYVYNELLQINEVITREVALFRNEKIPYIDVYLSLININAALSRFTSQAFSGFPPIIQTECHYWVHSLLGTGAANIAISKLASHIWKILGESKIPERLAVMEERSDRVPTLDQLASQPEFLNNDLLKSLHPRDKDERPIPIITYFSGRDGFSSHIFTLSAPLSTISECNSFRSSLLTITHELAHIQIRGVLSVVYPNVDRDVDVSLAIDMLRPVFKASNWLDAAKQLLLEGIVSMEQEWRGGEICSNELQDPVAVRRMLRSWRRETQEILVHAFDFLYFYAGNPQVYVSSIWNSWCAIPGIADRVPEYVMRTLCAVGASFLRCPHPNRLTATRDEVLAQLKAMQDSGGLISNYVDLAMDHIDKCWEPVQGGGGIKNKLRAGLLLTRFVKAFLYSETFAAKIYSDSYIASAGTKGGGYAKTKNQFDLMPIGNPLRFLSENMKDSPTEAESLWVLHNLAFNSAEGLGS